YAPQELSEKKILWDYLTLVIDNWNGEVVIMGDFNEVCKQVKRYGSMFNVHGADAFNSFISAAGLEEVPLGGCSFTWCHKSATKMTKLDPFLISEGLMGSCPNILATTLDYYLSDHRPILMQRTWNDAQVTDSNAMTKLMKKMKNLKEKIRAWIKLKKDSSKNIKKTLKAELAKIDLLLDKEESNSDVLNKRISVSKPLQELDKLESMEVAQKAKIKWVIKEDEILKYYHGVLNKKISQLAIRALDKSPGPDGFTFGIYRRWCGWIRSCLRSSRGSVIVNGSPTHEFQFHRGLKQGDPLSSFLFILIMESLHILVQRVVDRGMFRGISMGLSLHLSHLSYADDAVFMGSGKDWMCDARSSFLLFRVEGWWLMSRVQSWNEIVNNLVARLSNWKMKTLSIGGRLTLLKSVLGKKPIWVKWSKVLASKEKGGSSLWARVIEGIHGEDGKLGKNVNHNYPFIWLDIVREMEQLKNHDTNLTGFIHKKMGNGADTSFWEGVWRGDGAFKSLYPKIYALETCNNVTVIVKMSHENVRYSLHRIQREGIEQLQFLELLVSIEGVALVDMRDRWIWSLEGSGEFSVASV
ncbi:RNA-directed DNA polymerase, eukaryota, partial [Tanacetum coccineum]